MRDSTRNTVRNIPLPEAHLVAIGIAGVLHRLAPWGLPGTPVVRRIAGAVCGGAGLSILAAAVRSSSAVELGAPDALVTTGPFGRSRNPMYVGWMLLHVGVGLLSGSAWALTTVPAAAWRVHREVLAEERLLRRKFPGEYARYVAVVPRYIPRRRARSR